MATARDTKPEDAGRTSPLTFGADLGDMLTQARRPQRWFIANPGTDTPIPDDAFIARGYPVEIAGTVVAVDSAATRHGRMPVWVLDVGQGEDFPLVRVGLTANLLRNAHEQHGVQEGDKVAAVCRGTRQSRDTNPETGEPFVYEDWTVVVRKAPF